MLPFMRPGEANEIVRGKRQTARQDSVEVVGDSLPLIGGTGTVLTCLLIVGPSQMSMDFR